MLAIIRIILLVTLSIFICIFGLIYCLLNPRNPRNVAVIGRYFSYMSPLLGIKIKVYYPTGKIFPKNCIYIANHQNNYDMIIAPYVVQPRTITVGKKSLLWIPLFGLLYWLSGNLLIDRSNNIIAYSRLAKIARSIKKRNISIWIFPEGTRSYGRGLLPFKTGAFYAAIIAKVPIVPICISNTSNKIKLNRWSNGLIIIEMLLPIETDIYNHKKTKILTQKCQEIMQKKIHELNLEVFKQENIVKK